MQISVFKKRLLKIFSNTRKAHPTFKDKREELNLHKEEVKNKNVFVTIEFIFNFKFRKY